MLKISQLKVGDVLLEYYPGVDTGSIVVVLDIKAENGTFRRASLSPLRSVAFANNWVSLGAKDLLLTSFKAKLKALL